MNSVFMRPQKDVSLRMILKIEYHAVGDNWWQSLLSYGK